MARFLAAVAALLVAAGVLVAWGLTRPDPLLPADASRFAGGDAARGESVFWAGGCASCHAAPGATEDGKLVLAGGVALETPFGTFHAPNISSDPQNGIGAWTELDFANAMLRGVSPEGAHYYPAFPYTSYAKVDDRDIADLFAFLGGLKPDATPSKPHELPFPYNIRRAMGVWKRLYLSDDPVVDVADDPVLLRGRLLVEGLGHCGECHTPRDALGGPVLSKWLAGAEAPEGPDGKRGRVPNITPHETGIGSWSASEIEEALKSGFTPEFDSLGGSMAAVVSNTARLSDADRSAIAAYLKAVPALATVER